MVTIISVLICAVVVWRFYVESKTRGAAAVCLAPFWYFSIIFLIAFPFRAYLLNENIVPAQIDQNAVTSELYPASGLVASLIYALILWGGVLWGRVQTTGFIQPSVVHPTIANPDCPRSASRIYVILLMLGFASFAALYYISSTFEPTFGGLVYQRSRMGGGVIWIAPEFFVWAIFGLFAWFMYQRDGEIQKKDIFALIILFVVTTYISGELHTRRLISSVALGMVLLFVVRNTKYWVLMAISIVMTFTAAPALDVLRTLYLSYLKGEGVNIGETSDVVFNRFLLYQFSGTFEGAGHVARFFDQASLLELLTGVDRGLSWLFNSGLALVPRGIWETKPLIYGGLEQFHWMYPHMFKDGFAESSVPVSFAVDFAFGFGTVFAFVVAMAFGRLLGVAERSFQDRTAHVVDLTLSIFIFVFMFNWVRGGTIIVQSIALLCLPMFLMFGVMPTVRRVFGIAGEVVGLVGGDWRGVNKVYFFPHKYLRERQLDTIRNWPQHAAANFEAFKNRSQNNVTKEQALSTPKPSWKNCIPLVNIKRRPKDAPTDACVYVWGAIVAKGPYITDIDNPYAYTGYNVVASWLFRPVIKSFLLSPRCLEIRCMSQACLNGMRNIYGEEVAAKCLVSYPDIKLQRSIPNQQKNDQCRFVYVSTQFELKGGAALLNAFERVVSQCPWASLDLITYLPEHLEDVARRIPNLHVHSANLSREEVDVRFLANADVLVHPTYMDSFGMVVLEGMAQGLPVIATDVYALSEMVEDGKNGILIDPPISSWDGLKPSDTFSDVAGTVALSRSIDMGDFEDNLYEALLSMAQNPKQREQASAHSIALMRTRFAKLS